MREGNVLHLSVSHSVHRGGLCGRGVCVAKGGGSCMAGRTGVAGRRRCVWQGACVAGETATAMGCTHPSGMQSC